MYMHEKNLYNTPEERGHLKKHKKLLQHTPSEGNASRVQAQLTDALEQDEKNVIKAANNGKR